MALKTEEIDLLTFGMDDADNEYLTFEVGPEKFGLAIKQVREIIGVTHITRVPHLPEFMTGVINLRGKVIPVVDLRIKFNSPNRDISEEACIIVVDIDGEMVGMLSDRVSDVMHVPADQIEETPKFGEKINTDFLSGVGRIASEVILFIDLEKVIATEEQD